MPRGGMYWQSILLHSGLSGSTLSPVAPAGELWSTSTEDSDDNAVASGFAPGPAAGRTGARGRGVRAEGGREGSYAEGVRRHRRAKGQGSRLRRLAQGQAHGVRVRVGEGLWPADVSFPQETRRGP